MEIREQSDAQAGYTLLETLVAFIVLSISTAGFYQAWSITAQALYRADRKHEALIMSSYLLERLGTPDLPLHPGEYTSPASEDMFWHVSITPYNDSMASRLQLMNIDVTVFAEENNDTPLMRVHTLRLGARSS